MNPRDLVTIATPSRYPGLPTTPALVTGEQTRHGVELVRLSWPDQAAWIPADQVIPIARLAH